MRFLSWMTFIQNGHQPWIPPCLLHRLAINIIGQCRWRDDPIGYSFPPLCSLGLWLFGKFRYMLLAPLTRSSVNLKKEMVTHSSTLAWRIPWTEEPGRLLSMGSQRVRQDWVTITPSLSELDWFRTRPVRKVRIRATDHFPAQSFKDPCSLQVQAQLL